MIMVEPLKGTYDMIRDNGLVSLLPSAYLLYLPKKRKSKLVFLVLSGPPLPLVNVPWRPSHVGDA